MLTKKNMLLGGRFLLFANALLFGYWIGKFIAVHDWKFLMLTAVAGLGMALCIQALELIKKWSD